MVNDVWTEKYRPKSSDKINNSDVYDVIMQFRENGGIIPSFIFCGPPGSGKTSLIKIIRKVIFGKSENMGSIYVNASEKRGINVVREDVEPFVLTKSFTGVNKMVILDEADSLTGDSQVYISNCIDMHRDITFVLLYNYSYKILKVLSDQCLVFVFPKIDDEFVEGVVMRVVENEGLKIGMKQCRELIAYCKGDLRAVITHLQQLKFVYGLNKIVSIKHITHKYVDSVIDFIRDSGYSYEVVCEFIRENNIDVVIFIRYLLDELLEGYVECEGFDGVFIRIVDVYNKIGSGCLKVGIILICSLLEEFLVQLR